jgi:hypothetical protein
MMDKTARGFGIFSFIDRYNSKCSLQKSSLATEDCIWLGVDDANPQLFVPNGQPSWSKYKIPDDVHLTTRMHLTIEQVKELLPILKKFVKTGEINV